MKLRNLKIYVIPLFFIVLSSIMIGQTTPEKQKIAKSVLDTLFEGSLSDEEKFKTFAQNYDKFPDGKAQV